MSQKKIDLQKELDKCNKEKQEYLDGWKREKADFINYKKEESERIKTMIEYGNKDLISRILPILDNFELALKEIPKNQENTDLIKGLEQIKFYFIKTLKDEGLTEINCLGEFFDPYFHEAVEVVEDEKKESGIIIEEIQKGYKMNNKLIRPAKVRVVK